MTRIEYINENIERIKTDIKAGLISPTLLRHWEIYCRFDYYRKTQNSVCMSVFFTSEDLDVKEIQIYRVKKQMEAQI